MNLKMSNLLVFGWNLMNWIRSLVGANEPDQLFVDREPLRRENNQILSKAPFRWSENCTVVMEDVHQVAPRICPTSGSPASAWNT